MQLRNQKYIFTKSLQSMIASERASWGVGAGYVCDRSNSKKKSDMQFNLSYSVIKV